MELATISSASMPAKSHPFLLSQFLKLRNALDYPLRELFRWRRSGLILTKRAHTNLFESLAPENRQRAERRAEQLKEQYHLHSFAADSTPLNYRENLFYLDMLETALEQSGASLPDPLNAADIGPSHWFYIQAYHALLSWWHCSTPRSIKITGYEVDAYRVYADMHSRYDYARAHMRNLKGVTYLAQGFSCQPRQFDLISLLFPFVFEKDHLEWGLPAGKFQPEALLNAAWESLKPSGVLIIVNQGLEEHTAQRARLEQAGIPIRAAFRQDPTLYPYDLERYVLTARRDA